MDKTQAQALARELAANLATVLSRHLTELANMRDLAKAPSCEDETATMLEAKSGEAWAVGTFAEGDTWEQNDTSDFALQESRSAPGVWCVVEYEEGTPAFCWVSPEACFPLA